MLRQLQIEGYGLIERAEVEFAQGATIFTGETGSGKTMLIGALDFALGARAGPDVVRQSARRALVTLAFDPDESLRAQLAAQGFELDAGEVGTIAREMTEAGRSALRINGRPSTAAQVREMREAIVEMVGQHEAQRLLSPAYHLELLDRFAGDAALALRSAVAETYQRVQELEERLAGLTHDERRAQERYEDAVFTLHEIEEARLQTGEIETLNQRRGYLDNVERIATALHGAHEALAADERGAVEALGTASAALGAVAKFDEALHALAQRLSVLQTDTGDVTVELARALEGAQYDPAELEAVNARLDSIDRLKRKYGSTIEDILSRAAQARAIVEEYEGRDRRVAQLQSEVGAANDELRERAASLSTARQRAAARLTKRIVAEFTEIALASARFEVAFEPLERIGRNGAERSEFLFAANAGEPARPLARVASGGELSRVLLALVVSLADARDARSAYAELGRSALVFDEIDAGIGGATATAVGARIGDLARRGQLVCVTHLAQLATWADRHYVLDKLERKRQTTIVVRPIATAKDREAEIARMLSGESHDVALRHARSLLQLTKR